VTIKGGISTNVTGLTANANYYVQDDGSLQSPTVSVPYVIVGASFVDSFDLSNEDTLPFDAIFNNDGTKMFVAGGAGDDINEYTLSTAYDVSTATFVDSLSVAAKETSPQATRFNNDGTKMFVVGTSSDSVHEYTLSTGFDVSTATFSQSFSVSGQTSFPTGLAFNSDGTKMFVNGDGDIKEYALSTGFNISTASFTDSFDTTSQDSQQNGLTFNTDGTKMYVVGMTNDKAYEYTLSTGFDVSTATFSQDFSISAQEDQPRNIEFNSDGTKFFITGTVGDDVGEFTSGVGSATTVLAGKALSSTSINLDYTT
jgi:sugar lactone lactonase YvrE